MQLSTWTATFYRRNRILTSLALGALILSALTLSNASYADFPSLKDATIQSANLDGQTQSKAETPPDKIELAIQQAIDTSLQPFSGSVLLLRDGKPLLTVNKGRGINTKTSFIIASLSKQITATLILQAVDAGKLNLNHSLNSYLIDDGILKDDRKQEKKSDLGSDSIPGSNPDSVPDEDFDAKFETAPLEEIALDADSKLEDTQTSSTSLQAVSPSQEASEPKEASSPAIVYGIDVESAQKSLNFDPNRYDENITLHHLLSHTSGVNKLGKPNHFKPGSQFQYSNFGYSLLGEILEWVNQQTLAQQIANLKLINRLGGLYAEVGTIDNIRQRAPSLAIGLNESGGVLAPSGIEVTESLLPAGGIIATTQAFATFQRKLHSGRLISHQSYQLMTSSHTDIDFLWPNMSYGYGLRINREDGITEYSHTGYLPGYMSMTLHYPEFNLDLVMLENISLNVNDLHRVFELHNQIRASIRESLIYSKSRNMDKIDKKDSTNKSQA
ncbi:serine hydrolase domain-containing protein [Shewanella violacea]|uniref:Beta-lactamase-related domain-containing protein n=1 Tax=Shewanella violacea (strain JCM 10179 / CIP 106290 / LMG 19151 / DSS12) TaxID=637905 RepID=D4ZBM1_SHEVD|nr:serine hydrolase [Shewanella violacea]BAJ03416.1 conserved hypothetical protein [Shewanella violacea DSS12]